MGPLGPLIGALWARAMGQDPYGTLRAQMNGPKWAGARAQMNGANRAQMNPLEWAQMGSGPGPK
jgi:hypothetical protein